jgi:predicted RNase H-like HicB family nuclease
MLLQVQGLRVGSLFGFYAGMSIKLKDVQTKVIKEKDGSYSIACSAVAVYTSGKTLQQAKRNFEEALEPHLSVLREKAIEAVAR